MIRAFGQTENVAVAAALGVCGVPVVTEPLLDERSGRARLVCRLGMVNVLGAEMLRGISEEWGWEMDPRALYQSVKKGTLEGQTPDHPAVAALLALHNRDALEGLRDRGEKCRLVPLRVAQAGRAFYEGADSLEGFVAGTDEMMMTRDLAVAAALGVVGVPVCGVREQGRQWLLKAKGQALIGKRFEPMTADAVSLVKGLRDGTLAKESPWDAFLIGVQAIAAADRLAEMLGKNEKLVALRPPGTKKHAVVREQASDAVLDRTRRHFRI